MPLPTGARLGTYEITHAIGAGGMGEVYRARDSKLGRSVAIKVILQPFAADSERIARFQREAKVLASINHPNIAALYGMEESGDQHFLVMELVEGETLAERLQRGPVPVEDALRIGLQVADALETAHETGVVHRDLKPANIKITPDEKVKVLDFGLAKAVETEAPGGGVENSPTLSIMATHAGVILGTAAYMSPEQAKGFPADHRSDIFSFGVVLYEMLTGRRPFAGETAPDVLASVLVREADLERLPANLNPRLLELLRRCLEKAPKKRWQAIGDVRAELEAIAAAPRCEVRSPPGPPPALWRRALPPLAAAAASAALAGALAWQLKPSPPDPVTRFAYVLPEGQRFTTIGRQILSLSPDGRQIAYVSNGRLYLHSFAQFTSAPIPGTETYQNVFSPTFSPDGGSVAFFAALDQTLKRTPTTGGAAVTIARPSENPWHLDWSEHGILFSQGSGVMLVSANGGEPQKIAEGGSDERVQRVQMLPGGDVVLFTLGSLSVGGDRWMAARIVAHSRKTGETKTLLDGGSDGWYVPTGHLLYMVGGSLYAVQFDVDRLEIKGGPTAVVEGVRRTPLAGAGLAWFSVSPNGNLAYAPGPASLGSTQLDVGFVDRQGRVTPLKLPPALYDNPRISPSGRWLAVGVDDGRETSVLIYDIPRGGSLQRVTFGGKNRLPIWTSDSSRVVYQSDRDGASGIYWQPVDGSRGPERLTTAEPGEAHIPESWLPGGDVLLFSILKDAEYTLWTYSVRERKAAPFGNVRSRLPTDGAFSPDGRWVAYSSGDAMMTTTVYVQPYPATGAMYQYFRRDLDSPHHPVWAPSGAELILNPRPASFDAVAVSTRPTFAFGDGVEVKKIVATGPPTMRRPFDIAPDGRFVGLISPGDGVSPAASSRIDVVLNWFEELKSRAPLQQ